MSKRPCPAPKPVSCDSFDIAIHPLFPVSSTDMPVCAEIVSNVTAQAKDHPLSLIILADISGSMLFGHKVHSMRQGIVRLGELANRFATVHIELSIIEFNDKARLVHSSPTMPSVGELRRISDELWPSGGTNIGAALQMAIELAAEKRAVHIVLFTDGEDGCGLDSKLVHHSPREDYIAAMHTLPGLFVHCVGLSDGVDNRLLDAIARTARRGTFQNIQEESISRLMGSLWGLMMEVSYTCVSPFESSFIQGYYAQVVDANCAVSVDIDGQTVLCKETVLRVCDPPFKCRVLIPKVPSGTQTIAVTLRVGEDASKSQTLEFPKKSLDDHSIMDQICAIEAIADIEAQACAEVAQALSTRDFDRARNENLIAIQAIKDTFCEEETASEIKESAEAALNSLAQLTQDIIRSQDDYAIVRETELRAMSRASTNRNSGASIDPHSQSLSELQSQLSQY